MLTVAIVEDDLKSAQLLTKYIERYNEEKKEQLTVLHFTNGLNFISEYKANCDIVLMDIEMPHMNGLETAKKLRMRDTHIPLIFITNMAQYAINGYEVQALDFMVKPVEYFNFSLKLDRAVRICKENKISYVYIQSDLGMRKIYVETLPVEKRIISLIGYARKDVMGIHMENYCEKELKFQDGLPVSTKGNMDYHGFGLKSVRYVVEKYGGNLVIGLENQIFSMDIIFPVL